MHIPVLLVPCAVAPSQSRFYLGLRSPRTRMDPTDGESCRCESSLTDMYPSFRANPQAAFFHAYEPQQTRSPTQPLCVQVSLTAGAIHQPWLVDGLPIVIGCWHGSVRPRAKQSHPYLPLIRIVGLHQQCTMRGT